MSNFTKNLLIVIDKLGGYAAAATASKLKSTQTFYNWNKKIPQQFSNLVELADAAGVSLDWLLGRDGAVKDFPPAAAVPATTDAAADAAAALIEIPIWRSDGSPERSLDYMTFRAGYLNNRLRIPPSELVLVPVATAAASPTLMHGGVCICHTAAEPEDGIWACAPKGASKAAFRRVMLRDNGVLLYPVAAADTAVADVSYPMSAPAFRSHSIGRVVWGGGAVL